MSFSSYDLWAKTGEGESNWHALPYHLADTAAIAQALWRAFPPTLQIHVAKMLDLKVEEAEQQVAFLASIHDIGKANPIFQYKAPEHRSRLARWGLKSTGESEPHGQATHALLFHWLKNNFGYESSVANQVAAAVGGHHGTIFTDNRESLNYVNEDPWKSVAYELLNELRQLLGTTLVAPERSDLGAFCAWLAGFVTVSDWLASHERMVSYCSERLELAKYFEIAKIRATNVLEELDFRFSQPNEAVGLLDIVPTGAVPKPMQIIADQIAPTFRFAIIEAPTGEGKTEAALALAEPSRAEGRGLYFAMPTMATANGLVNRIDSYLKKATRDQDEFAQLLHSLAWLQQGTRVRANPGDYEQAAVAEDWFASSKRGLLRTFGVGTIDQALTGVILVKHFFVRLFALAGKVVIVDEVHAYDTYMGDLLQTLIAWLRVLDCRVVLLSATLPSLKRVSLLEAWGIIGPPPSPCYPAITFVNSAGLAVTESFEVSPRKLLRFEHLTEPPDKLILDQIVQSGGTGAIIVNTVKQAIQIYKAVQEFAQDLGVEVTLFHARFTVEDRQRIEQFVLEKFGKSAVRDRPRLLIATQVVEQSLDLDFDFMVTELAPIDLMIQRAGRLHRHERDLQGALASGPDKRPDPILKIWIPEKLSVVYSPAILEASQRVSMNLVISTPTCIASAVENVYSDPYVLESESLLKEDARRHNEAQKVLVPTPEKWRDLKCNKYGDDADGSRGDLIARTRLESLPSKTIIVLAKHAPGIDNVAVSNSRRLFLCSVRMSAYTSQLEELDQLEQGEDWRKSKFLKFAVLARLSEDEVFETDSWLYHYSKETGLEWTKKK